MYGRRGSDERMYGGSGADHLVAGAGRDLLSGGAGPDDLRSFNGRDRLVLGAGRDVAWAGAGDDVLDARDRTLDGVGCGRDDDTVRNDPRDWLVRCEHHDRGRTRTTLSGF
jgi:Ca2+-binding RTX toxin-like protein